LQSLPPFFFLSRSKGMTTDIGFLASGHNGRVLDLISTKPRSESDRGPHPTG
jgi:hypothetical protein